MHKVQFSGKVEEYQGKRLDTPIEYSGEADSYDNVAEARQGEDWLGDSEILKVINTKKLTAAKAAKYQESTKALKEAYENSADFKRANLVKAMLAAGFSQAEAEAMAASKLG